MAQVDIMDYLRQKRLSGDHRYFSRAEIERDMGSQGVSVHKCRMQLNKLYVYHYLDIKFITLWNRRYRLKRKYVKEGVV